MYREQRRRFLVERKVQGALLRQGIWYWFLAIAVYVFVVATFRIAPLWFAKQTVDAGVIWYHVSPMVIASASVHSASVIGSADPWYVFAMSFND